MIVLVVEEPNLKGQCQQPRTQPGRLSPNANPLRKRGLPSGLEKIGSGPYPIADAKKAEDVCAVNSRRFGLLENSLFHHLTI
jgi:hypothetical protein